MNKPFLFKLLLFCSFVTIAPPNITHAETVIKVALAQLPDVEKHPKESILVELLEAMDKHSTDIRIEILEMPFARTLVQLARGHVDAQLPIMYDPADALGATDYMEQFGIKLNDFAYTDENLFKAHFVVVSREEVKITPQNIAQHDVVTDLSHVAFFKKQFPGSHSMKVSIAKVKKGTLSGYLFEEHKVNQVIRELDFIDHRLNSYAFFDVRFMVRNIAQGNEVKKLLDDAVAELKESGEFDRVMFDLINDYGY